MAPRPRGSACGIVRGEVDAARQTGAVQGTLAALAARPRAGAQIRTPTPAYRRRSPADIEPEPRARLLLARLARPARRSDLRVAPLCATAVHAGGCVKASAHLRGQLGEEAADVSRAPACPRPWSPAGLDAARRPLGLALGDLPAAASAGEIRQHIRPCAHEDVVRHACPTGRPPDPELDPALSSTPCSTPRPCVSSRSPRPCRRPLRLRTPSSRNAPPLPPRRTPPPSDLARSESSLEFLLSSSR